MRSLIDMHAQDRTNRRLGRLTVLSDDLHADYFSGRNMGYEFQIDAIIVP